MPEPHDTSGESDQFDVVILGFEARNDTPEVGLKRVFGLDEQAAQRVLTSLPATVQRGVNRVRAEYFRKALGSIGAHVEVRNPQGEPQAPPSLAPSPPKEKPVAPAPPSVESEQARAFAMQATDRPPPNPEVPVVQLNSDWYEPKSPAVESEAHQAQFGATQMMPSGPQTAVASAPSDALNLQPSAASRQAVRETALAVRGAANATLLDGSAMVARPEPERPKAEIPLRAAMATNIVAPSMQEPRDMHGTQPQPAVPMPQAVPIQAFRFGGTDLPMMPKARAAQAAASVNALDLPAPRTAEVSEPAALAMQDTHPQPSAAGPVTTATPAAEEATDVTYGGFAWGELDRGRHSAPPKEAAAVQPVSLPASSKDEGQKQASRRAPSRGIDPIAPMPAPDNNAIVAALRKQRMHSNESSLGDAHEQPMVPMLGRFEQGGVDAQGMAKAARPLTQRRAQPQMNPGPQPNPPREKRKPSSKTAKSDASEPSKPEDSRTFWEAVPDALTFPLRPGAMRFMLSVAMVAAVVSLISLIAGQVPLLGAVVSFAANTVLIALCADFTRRCLWHVAAGEPDLDRGPALDAARIVQTYAIKGLHLSAFWMLSQIPLLYWISKQWPTLTTGNPLTQLLLSPMLWFLAIGPGFYWPMAVITTAIENDFSGVWNVALGVRAILRAPLEYIAIAALSGLAFIAGFGVVVVVGAGLGLPPVFFGACLGLPLAFSHGLIGALSGHLARARSHTFQ